jgi:hypothetical protein
MIVIKISVNLVRLRKWSFINTEEETKSIQEEVWAGDKGVSHYCAAKLHDHFIWLQNCLTCTTP